MPGMHLGGVMVAEGTQSRPGLHNCISPPRDLAPLSCARAALSSLLTLIEDDAPTTSLDRQHVQSTLELITEGLLPWVDDMTPQLLVGTLCLLAKLRYYDGPLLARLMQAPQQRGGGLLASFKPWQASGMLWALGR